MTNTVKCLCGCTHIIESGGKIDMTLLTKKCFKCGEKISFKDETPPTETIQVKEDVPSPAQVPEKKRRGRPRKN